MKLEKSGEKCRLQINRDGGPQGEIRIHLDWDHQVGFMRRVFGEGEIDLDLGCFYQMRNGKKTLIDGLQFSRNRVVPRDEVSRQGCYTAAPYIWHTGDDKGSSDDKGETILVNPDGLNEIERIIIYTFIYEGATKWTDTKATLRLRVPGCEDVEVYIGDQPSKQRFCALMEIDINPDGTIDVTRLGTFHDGHSDCDRAYGWGFNYAQRHK